MSTSTVQLDLDKLRNSVQKFDAYSFTAALVANEYIHGEAAASDELVAFFAEQLQRHAQVLGIQAQPAPNNGSATVWRTL